MLQDSAFASDSVSLKTNKQQQINLNIDSTQMTSTTTNSVLDDLLKHNLVDPYADIVNGASNHVSTSTLNNNNTATAATASVSTEPVQAYAKIEGRDFTYFVRKLQVVLGRKIAQGDDVDVHLGNIKSISRNHAKIQFNFQIQNFEIVVTGKNGAVVDGNFVGVNSHPVPLYNKSKITIGEIECQFLLPKSDNDD
ncbi:UNVERIFIED_CONTAM: Pre-rRNA-processing protein fhl1, partial [Siphonaria sp. JEL0065]